MLKLSSSTGDGTFKPLFTVESSLEGVTSSFNFKNTTGTELEGMFRVAGIDIPITIPATPTSNLERVIAIPFGSVVSMKLPTGVSVVISYMLKEVDMATAITLTKDIIAAIPEAQLKDDTVSDKDTWSSEKISTELDTKITIEDLHAASLYF